MEIPEEEIQSVNTMSELYNNEVAEYLKNNLLSVTNEYVENELKALYQKEFLIVGYPLLYEKCPCCEFRTLSNTCDYDICPNCYWEDDGLRELEKFSSVNNMTLREGKENYTKFSACAVEFIKLVEVNKSKYLK